MDTPNNYKVHKTRAGSEAVVLGEFKGMLYGAWHGTDDKWYPCMWHQDGKFYEGAVEMALDLMLSND